LWIEQKPYHNIWGHWTHSIIIHPADYSSPNDKNF
jgi:hypothetical protein